MSYESSEVVTTVRVSQYQKAANMIANAVSYPGLQICALPGLHSYLAERLQMLVPPPEQVLEMAAGSSAMLHTLP